MQRNQAATPGMPYEPTSRHIGGCKKGNLAHGVGDLQSELSLSESQKHVRRDPGERSSLAPYIFLPHECFIIMLWHHPGWNLSAGKHVQDAGTEGLGRDEAQAKYLVTFAMLITYLNGAVFQLEKPPRNYPPTTAKYCEIRHL